MMPIVEVGQRWSMHSHATRSDARLHFTITSVDMDRGVAGVLYDGPHRRGGSVRLRTLRRGLRGARLENDRDGTVTVCDPTRMPKLLDKAEDRTASALRRVQGPRGLGSPAAQRAAQLRQQGLSTAAIAAKLGLSNKTVSRYLSECRLSEFGR